MYNTTISILHSLQNYLFNFFFLIKIKRETFIFTTIYLNTQTRTMIKLKKIPNITDIRYINHYDLYAIFKANILKLHIKTY